ncbi:MAG: hypothetical protein ACOYMA_02990 [Bacteroidia bacterium]
MKSIFLFMSILCVFYFQTENTYSIKLGKAPDCNGFNFCNVAVNNETSRKENEVLATIDVLDEKHIQFSFLKRTVTDKLFLKYFATGQFLLDEDYAFNEEICTTLELKRCNLKQGKYTITDEYDKYVVVFVF